MRLSRTKRKGDRRMSKLIVPEGLKNLKNDTKKKKKKERRRTKDLLWKEFLKQQVGEW